MTSRADIKDDGPVEPMSSCIDGPRLGLATCGRSLPPLLWHGIVRRTVAATSPIGPPARVPWRGTNERTGGEGSKAAELNPTNRQAPNYAPGRDPIGTRTIIPSRLVPECHSDSSAALSNAVDHLLWFRGLATPACHPGLACFFGLQRSECFR